MVGTGRRKGPPRERGPESRRDVDICQKAACVLPGEAGLSLSHYQTHSELMLVLPGPLGRGFLILPGGNSFARIVCVALHLCK